MILDMTFLPLSLIAHTVSRHAKIFMYLLLDVIKTKAKKVCQLEFLSDYLQCFKQTFTFFYCHNLTSPKKEMSIYFNNATCVSKSCRFSIS